MKRRSKIIIFSGLFFLALLFSVRYFVLQGQQTTLPPEPPSQVVQQIPVIIPEPQPEPEPEPEPQAEPERIPLVVWPVRISIPALGLDSVIEDTGYDATHTMEIVPSAEIISWLRESAIPSNNGNAILGGHNKWRGNICPLYDLDTLEIGEEMKIEYEGGLCLKFKLESVFVYALATAPAGQIMNVGGEARVTIITCKPPYNPKIGTSDNRIVAIFKEESVFVIPDPPIEPFPPVQK